MLLEDSIEILLLEKKRPKGSINQWPSVVELCFTAIRSC